MITHYLDFKYSTCFTLKFQFMFAHEKEMNPLNTE